MACSRRQFLSGAIAAAGLGTTGCAARFESGSSYLGRVVRFDNYTSAIHWLDIALQQIRDQRLPPPRAAYNLAMPTVAGFVAANAVTSRYHDTYRVGAAPVGADPHVAYGEAFATAAAEVFQQPFVFERAAFRKRFADGQAKDLGVKWGCAVGKHFVRIRTDDGSEPSEVNYYLNRYQRRSDALRWSPTGPHYGARPGPAFKSYTRALFPGHGAIKPWTTRSSSQFRAHEFYDPASPEFAAEFDRIRRLGGRESAIRTAEEEEIALFWEDGPWGITPPGHFMLIAAQVLQDRQSDFMAQARAFALLAMTQCDASISAWDSKYAHDIIRPETAIRHRAEAFRNPDGRVARKPGWKSLIPTPEFPSYTSGHSTFGAAAAEMLALICGTDRISIGHQAPDQVIWPQLKGVVRRWTSLSQMAEENGMSRLYGGVHWQLDHDQAMYAGKMIARQAHETFFRRRS